MGKLTFYDEILISKQCPLKSTLLRAAEIVATFQEENLVKYAKI